METKNGNNDLAIQLTGGNTGFGTSTPTSKLDVNGTIASSGSQSQHYQIKNVNGSRDLLIARSGTSDSGETDRVAWIQHARISSTSHRWRFWGSSENVSTQATGLNLYYTNGAMYAGFGNLDTPDRPISIRGASAGDLIGFHDNATSTAQWHMKLQGTGDGDLGFTESGVADNRLVLEAGGNVGINEANPDEMLHMTSTGSVRIKLEADTNNIGEGDQPQILMSQDGAIVTGYVGYANALNRMYLTNNNTGS